jgi:hypothetical protein
MEEHESRKSASPIIGIVIFVLLAGVVAGLVIPIIVRSGRSTRGTSSTRNLNQIGKALQMYSDAPENKGLPASLSTLYPNYVADRTVFLNPNDPAYDHKVKELKAAKGVSIIDYAYEPGLNINDALDIVAYEKVPVGGGRNVLVLGGSVEYVPEADFQKRLAEQRARLAAKMAAPPNPPAQ